MVVLSPYYFNFLSISFALAVLKKVSECRMIFGVLTEEQCENGSIGMVAWGQKLGDGSMGMGVKE